MQFNAKYFTLSLAFVMRKCIHCGGLSPKYTWWDWYCDRIGANENNLKLFIGISWPMANTTVGYQFSQHDDCVLCI